MPDPVADAINELVPTDGMLVGAPEPDAPAPPAAEAAEVAPEPEVAPSAEAAPEAAAAETLDIEALAEKLTPEQFKALLAKRDAEEIVRTDDRLSGKVGALAQRQAREIVESQERQAREQSLKTARAQALENRDPDAALEVLQQLNAGEDQAAHLAAWENATGVFNRLDGDPVTKPLVAHLGGRDYGRLSGGDGTPENPGNGHLAALLYRADLADSIVSNLPDVLAQVRAETNRAWEKRVKDEIEPAVERRVRALLVTAAPAPITGSSTGAGGQSDNDFLEAYGRGESNDHRRARQLTGIT